MRPAGSKVSVIVPTYNEGEHIVRLIDNLYEKIDAPLEVIVVDDQSSDGTADLVASMEREGLVLIRRKCRGLASAFMRGIIESTGDIVCWMDADRTMPVDVLKKMIDRLDENHIAVGSRYAEGGGDDRSFLRVGASRLINGLAGLVLGGGIGDYDSGFIALRRESFNYATVIPYGYGEYFIEFLFDAHCAGLKITEVGYQFRDRDVGTSKSAPNLWAFFRTGIQYVVRIFSARFKFLFKGRR